MTEELDLAPVSRPEPQGTWDAPPPEGAAWRVSDFFNAMDAADKAYQFDQDVYAKRNALSDAVDRRNTDVERATGVTLQNPYDGGYEAEARDRLFKSGQPGDIRSVKEQIWSEQLGALQTQYPDHADKIGADRPILEDAKQLADYWSDRAARGQPGLGATAGLAASFLGGMRGFARNPLNLASLLVGGGEVRATSIAGRIAEGFAREAAVNAGVQAVAEPMVQSFRAERGRESGLGAALTDIGEAGLFGGVFSAGAQTAKAAIGALRASRAPEAALRDLAATPVAEKVPELRAAVEAMDADAAALADPPAGVTGHVEAVGQALEHGEGLSDALPEFMLRPTEKSRASQLVEALSPAALDEMQSGRVSTHVALAAAARVTDEGEQLAVMRAAMAESPRNADEAAEAVSRAMQARALPVAQSHALETRVSATVPEAPGFRRVGERLEKHSAELERQLVAQPPAEDAPRAVIPVPRRTVTREFPTLFEALAGDGGLAPHPELAAIFDGNPFVPGFGKLVREGGRTLDQALTAAKELGYLYDPNEAPGAGPLSVSTSDLLDLLRRERHGERVHSQTDLAAMAEREAARASGEFERDRATALRALKKDFDLQPVRESGVLLWTADENILNMAATRMAADPELTPRRAYELAAHEYERDLWARSEQIPEVQAIRHEQTGDIPGWDIPFPGDANPFVDHVPEDRLFNGSGDASGRGADAARGGEGAPASGGGAGEAGAGARKDGGANRASEPLTEPGAEGKPQTLIPGVAPVSDKARAELAAAKPLRGGNAPAGGLFDEGARAQRDMFDAPTREIAVARDDGTTAFVARETLLAPDPAEQIPDLILGCRD